MVANNDELCNHVFPSRQIEIGIERNGAKKKSRESCMPIPGLGRFINGSSYF
jgi:hypothetical protein